MDHIMVIGAVIAVIGSIGAFVLVRQRDFVPSYAPSGPPEPAPSDVGEAATR
jgi:hypothetical protein